MAAPAAGSVLQAYPAPGAPAPAPPGRGNKSDKYIIGFVGVSFVAIAVFTTFYYQYKYSLDNYVPVKSKQPAAAGCNQGGSKPKPTVKTVKPPESYLSSMVISALAFVGVLFTYIFVCVDFSKPRQRNHHIADNGQNVGMDPNAPLAPTTHAFHMGTIWQELTGNGADLHSSVSAPAAPPTMFNPKASAPPPTHVAPLGAPMPAPGMSM